jgi:hypothetical protein
MERQQMTVSSDHSYAKVDGDSAAPSTIFEFRAPGLRADKSTLLMAVLTEERHRSTQILREEALRRADIVDHVLTAKDDVLKRAAADAAKRRIEDLKSVGLEISCVFGGGWLLSASAFMIYLTAISGFGTAVLVFVALPALAVVASACLLLFLATKEFLDDALKSVRPFLIGRYNAEDEAHLAYAAAAVWMLGRERVYMRAGRPYGNGYRTENRWTPEVRAVSYADIQSLEVDLGRGAVAFKCGEEEFGIEAEGLDALQIADEVIRRARDLDHDVFQMSIRGDPMAGVAKTVDADLLSRFARTVPGVEVGARNGLLEACLVVRMKWADEVGMDRRVAAFEGIPVRYIVGMRVDAPGLGKKSNSDGSSGRLLH